MQDNVMEEQMSLFDMGGLTDDGAMRDPVSGNDVPPGSMASEVRDDVPAMLSEGEYIVPADVVRYYGVKFFEDLRSQAKSGLMDMERNGRIGGEPVPMGGPQGEGELTPEEMAMLAEITGMYGGGMVRGAYQMGGMVTDDPRMTNYNMANYTSSIPRNQMMGYQVGGSVTTPPGVAPMTQADFMQQAQQASQFQLPGSIFAPSTPAPVQTPAATPATLYGPNGEVVTLMLPADQERYNTLLSQGYTTEPQEAAATMQGSGSDDGGVGVGTPEVTTGGGGFSLSEENREALSIDPIAFGMEALREGSFETRDIGLLGTALGGVPGTAIGGLVGAAMEIDNVAKANAALEVARSRGLADTPEFAELQTAVNTAVENLSGPARFLNRLGFGTGENYAEEALAGAGTAAPARPSGGVSARTPAPERDAVTFVTEGPARGTVQGSGQAARPGSRPAPTPSRSEESAVDRARRGSEEVISAAERNLATSEEIADMRAEAAKAEAQVADLESRTSPGGRNTTGRVGFEKGGLVAKPSRKKPVAKKK